MNEPISCLTRVMARTVSGCSCNSSSKGEPRHLLFPSFSVSRSLSRLLRSPSSCSDAVALPLAESTAVACVSVCSVSEETISRRAGTSSASALASCSSLKASEIYVLVEHQPKKYPETRGEDSQQVRQVVLIATQEKKCLLPPCFVQCNVQGTHTLQPPSAKSWLWPPNSGSIQRVGEVNRALKHKERCLQASSASSSYRPWPAWPSEQSAAGHDTSGLAPPATTRTAAFWWPRRPA